MGRKRYEPITVRFTKEALSVMREIADENGISVAEVVRMASAGNLANYLGDVRFVDKMQGDEIKARVGKLADVMSDIEVGLIRIGTNINQIARRVNTEAKYGIAPAGSGDAAALLREIGVLMDRYERATKEAGAICRILG